VKSSLDPAVTANSSHITKIPWTPAGQNFFEYKSEKVTIHCKLTGIVVEEGISPATMARLAVIPGTTKEPIQPCDAIDGMDNTSLVPLSRIFVTSGDRNLLRPSSTLPWTSLPLDDIPTVKIHVTPAEDEPIRVTRVELVPETVTNTRSVTVRLLTVLAGVTQEEYVEMFTKGPLLALMPKGTLANVVEVLFLPENPDAPVSAQVDITACFKEALLRSSIAATTPSGPSQHARPWTAHLTTPVRCPIRVGMEDPQLTPIKRITVTSGDPEGLRPTSVQSWTSSQSDEQPVITVGLTEPDAEPVSVAEVELPINSVTNIDEVTVTIVQYTPEGVSEPVYEETLSDTPFLVNLPPGTEGNEVQIVVTPVNTAEPVTTHVEIHACFEELSTPPTPAPTTLKVTPSPCKLQSGMTNPELLSDESIQVRLTCRLPFDFIITD